MVDDESKVTALMDLGLSRPASWMLLYLVQEGKRCTTTELSKGFLVQPYISNASKELEKMGLIKAYRVSQDTKQNKNQFEAYPLPKIKKILKARLNTEYEAINKALAELEV